MKLDTRLSGYFPSAAIIAVFYFIEGFFLLENEPGTVLMKSLIIAAVWMIVLFLLSRRRGRKAARVYNELSKKHTIHCQGLAVMGGKGAWMFLTDDLLLIYFDKISINGRIDEIPLDEIKTLTRNGIKKIEIQTTKHNYLLSVVMANVWEKYIKEQILTLKKSNR